MTQQASSSGRSREAERTDVALGVTLIVLGVLAILAPLASGVATEILIGLAFLIGGSVEIARGARLRRASEIFVGAIAAVCGLLLVLHPLIGLGFLTLLMVAYFLISGIVRILAAWQLRPHAGWGLVMTGGVISVVLGALIWLQWPLSGAWLLGTLVGISLVLSGAALAATGRAHVASIDRG